MTSGGSLSPGTEGPGAETGTRSVTKAMNRERVFFTVLASLSG